MDTCGIAREDFHNLLQAFYETTAIPIGLLDRNGNGLIALGGEIETSTPDGHAKIKIPPEAQTGAGFRPHGGRIKALYPWD